MMRPKLKAPTEGGRTIADTGFQLDSKFLPGYSANVPECGSGISLNKMRIAHHGEFRDLSSSSVYGGSIKVRLGQRVAPAGGPRINGRS